MIENYYTEYAIHKDKHVIFINQTAAFCIDTTEYKEGIPTEMLSYLKAWLTDHILNQI